MFGPANTDAIERNGYTVGFANADAVITIAADPQHYWVIDSVHWSYVLGTGTTGRLTITFGGVAKWDIDIIENGTGERIFDRGLYTGTYNEAVVITLAAGGTSVVGKVNCTYR